MLGYAAAGFALLQGLEIAAGAFEWGAVTLRIATVLFALGVPLTAVLAWFHGHQRKQHVSRLEIALLSALCVTALPLLWLAGWPQASPIQTQADPRTVAFAPTRTVGCQCCRSSTSAATQRRNIFRTDYPRSS